MNNRTMPGGFVGGARPMGQGMQNMQGRFQGAPLDGQMPPNMRQGMPNFNGPSRQLTPGTPFMPSEQQGQSPMGMGQGRPPQMFQGRFPPMDQGQSPQMDQGQPPQMDQSRFPRMDQGRPPQMVPAGQGPFPTMRPQGDVDRQRLIQALQLRGQM